MPDGWRVVDYGDARVAVPAAWSTVRSGAGIECAFLAAGGVVLLGTATVNSGCSEDATVVHLDGPAGSPQWGQVTEVNGLRVSESVNDARDDWIRRS